MNKVAKFAVLSLLPFSVLSTAHAARVTSIVSWENAYYGKGNAGSYAGWRVDNTISPDNSNWYFMLNLKQNRNKGNKNDAGKYVATRDYQRFDARVAYRFRLNNGWFQPSFGYRQDLNLYLNGNRLVNEYYQFDTRYIYNLSPRWTYKGYVKFEFNPREVRRPGSIDTAKIERNDQRLGWEIEQGVNYAFTPRLNVDFLLSDLGNTRENESAFNSTTTDRATELRIYLNYNTSFGLTLAPYYRRAVFGKVTTRNDVIGGVEHSKANRERLAMRANYKFNKNVTLISEYYQEKLNGINLERKTKQNYFRVGLRFDY